jgi:hypothetical protein
MIHLALEAVHVGPCSDFVLIDGNSRMNPLTLLSEGDIDKMVATDEDRNNGARCSSWSIRMNQVIFFNKLFAEDEPDASRGGTGRGGRKKYSSLFRGGEATTFRIKIDGEGKLGFYRMKAGELTHLEPDLDGNYDKDVLKKFVKEMQSSRKTYHTTEERKKQKAGRTTAELPDVLPLASGMVATAQQQGGAAAPVDPPHHGG